MNIKFKPLHGIAIDQTVWPLAFSKDGDGVWCRVRRQGVDPDDKGDALYLFSPVPRFIQRVKFSDERQFHLDMGRSLLLAHDAEAGCQLRDLETDRVLWNGEIEGIGAVHPISTRFWTEAIGEVSPAADRFVIYRKKKIRIYRREGERATLEQEMENPFSFWLFWGVVWHPSEQIFVMKVMSDNHRQFCFFQKDDAWHHVEAWDVETEDRIASGPYFSPDGKYFVYSDKSLHLFSFSPPTHLCSFDAHGVKRLSHDEPSQESNYLPYHGDRPWTNPVFRVGQGKWSPKLICGTPQGFILTIDLKTQWVTEKAHHHAGPVYGLALSSDGNTLVSSGEDRYVNVNTFWD